MVAMTARTQSAYFRFLVVLEDTVFNYNFSVAKGVEWLRRYSAH
jgi:hypothetical protein